MAAVKAVIDTNIWVSSFLNPSGFPARLRTAFEEGSFSVVVSAPMLEEIRDDDIKFDKKVSSKLSEYGVTVISVSKFLVVINMPK